MNFIVWTIVACEIGFWVVIIAGLVTRYVFNRKRLGLFFLALTPVIDLLLLLVTSFDLYHGATATQVHAIAAVYLGVSVAFGKSMIRWADERFLYYVKKQGKKPVKRTGYAHARHSLKGSALHAVAFLIGGTFLYAMIYFIGDADKTEALLQMLKLWTLILAIDFVISLSYFIWPRPSKL